MNILHVINDKKFIDSCKITFDLNYCHNFFLSKGEVTDSFVEKAHIDLIVFHYLNYKDASFILETKSKVKLVWFFWGADGFMFAKFHDRFILKTTRKIRLKCEFKKSLYLGIKCLLSSCLPSFVDSTKNYKNVLRAIDKIDCIVPVMPGDIDILCDSYKVTANVVHFNYLLTYFVDNVMNENPVFNYGHDILIGNSASYTSNHIEVIDILKSTVADRKIIIPLNYGDNIYGDEISRYAKKELGDTVVVLKDFLPFDEFEKVIAQCSILVMNHCRQQAVGNIILGLVHGKTIYLRTESTVYSFLLEKGFVVRKIQDIKSKGIVEIEEVERVNNYKLAFNVFGKETSRAGVIKLLTYLNK